MEFLMGYEKGPNNFFVSLTRYIPHHLVLDFRQPPLNSLGYFLHFWLLRPPTFMFHGKYLRNGTSSRTLFLNRRSLRYQMVSKKKRTPSTHLCRDKVRTMCWLSTLLCPPFSRPFSFLTYYSYKYKIITTLSRWVIDGLFCVTKRVRVRGVDLLLLSLWTGLI